jgi:hypothetical protein
VKRLLDARIESSHTSTKVHGRYYSAKALRADRIEKLSLVVVVVVVTAVTYLPACQATMTHWEHLMSCPTTIGIGYILNISIPLASVSTPESKEDRLSRIDTAFFSSRISRRYSIYLFIFEGDILLINREFRYILTSKSIKSKIYI